MKLNAMRKDEKHECHANGCHVKIQPRLFMCYKHWNKLPGEHQANIWATYRPGQETTKDPSIDYWIASYQAIKALAAIEGIPFTDTQQKTLDKLLNIQARKDQEFLNAPVN